MASRYPNYFAFQSPVANTPARRASAPAQDWSRPSPFGDTGGNFNMAGAVTGYNPLFSAPVLPADQRQQVAKWATSEGGYRSVEGNFAVRPGPGGVPTYTALSDVAKSNRYRQGAGQQGQFLNQAGQALAKDRNFLETNVLAPYQANTTQFGKDVDSGYQEIKDAAGQARSDMVGEMNLLTSAGAQDAARIRGAGAAYDEAAANTRADAKSINRGADQTYADVGKDLGDVSKRLDEAMALSREAIATAKSTAAGYDASAQETIRSYISSFENRTDSQMKMIEKGFDPQTGQPLRPAEQQQMRTQLLSESNRTIGENVLKFKDEAQQTLAMLRGEITKAQEAGAQIATVGAQTKVDSARTRAAAGESRDRTKLATLDATSRADFQRAEGKAGLEVNAADLTERYAGVRAGVAQTLAQLTNAAALNAVDYRLRGRTQYADLVANTPYVSVFEGFMAMASLASAPGVDKMPAMNFQI